jgi:hypothetical protein
MGGHPPGFLATAKARTMVEATGETIVVQRDIA